MEVDMIFAIAKLRKDNLLFQGIKRKFQQAPLKIY